MLRPIHCHFRHGLHALTSRQLMWPYTEVWITGSLPIVDVLDKSICLHPFCVWEWELAELRYLSAGRSYLSGFINKKAVLSQGNRAMHVLFGLNFTDNIHYKFKSSRASKHTGAKQSLTQDDHSRSFKVTCSGVSGKAIKD